MNFVIYVDAQAVTAAECFDPLRLDDEDDDGCYDDDCGDEELWTAVVVTMQGCVCVCAF